MHTNPHDVRQVWVRLPGLGLTEIPWIHRDHSHQPFNDRTWQYLQTITTRHADHDRYEADLAEALDQLMRRTRAGTATRAEQYLLARHTAVRTPPPATGPVSEVQAQELGPAATEAEDDSLDGLDQDAEDPIADEARESGEVSHGPAVPMAGYGLYDAQEEALKW